MNFWHQVRLFVPALIAVYGLSLAPAQAQFYQQGPKLVGTGAVGPYNPIQGSSVSLSGDGNTALVGGIYDTQKDGAAWVFTRSAGVWSQQAKLVGAGIVGHNAFQGLSVSLSSDGNTALVGGPDDDGQVGAAWVFTRADATWSQQAKLVPIDAVGVAGMGNSSSLASDGNTAIVGGPGDDNGVGAAWVFTRSPNGTWTQQAKLVGTGAIGNAVQGYSTSISGDGKTAIVGGTFDNNQIVTAPGAAWVFARSADGTWSQQAKLVGTGAVGNNAQQGFSVALSGDGSIAIVGGPYDDNQASSNGQGLGAAWVFTRSADGSWSQQAKLVGTGAIGNPGQGSSVSLSGDGNTAVIGGPYDNLPVNGSVGVGAAWVFARSGSTWSW